MSDKSTKKKPDKKKPTGKGTEVTMPECAVCFVASGIIEGKR